MRGGLGGGGCRGRRNGRGNWVIFIDDNMKTTTFIIIVRNG